MHEPSVVRPADPRFSDLLATVPVHVVMNTHVGLYGALVEAELISRVTK